ncbi:uncharacterized protein LOC107608804 [Arachis ipaensis]|uniref:uncharacterized protein LOC107608804 n=1 Tax=Arachis ipaensis TaxID=130454 RepID=UPI0007AF6F9E|nr:uncharacterized protein LOC107608804 [Arachis ipaensis]XP_025667162.1 uncharacterized protein LOC112765479 [Arachis hypogaea]
MSSSLSAALSLSVAASLLPAVTASPPTLPCSLLYWSFVGCASSASTSLLLLLWFVGASHRRTFIRRGHSLRRRYFSRPSLLLPHLAVRKLSNNSSSTSVLLLPQRL